jgi:threonine dehydratase
MGDRGRAPRVVGLGGEGAVTSRSTVSSMSMPDIRRAQRLLANTVRTTPLIQVGIDGSTWAKVEAFQVTGAFKFRGALNAARAVRHRVRTAGLVTASTGNHAIGVAAAAHHCDLTSVVVMSPHSPDTKQRAARSYGAEIVLEDGPIEALREVALRIAADRGYEFISSYDDPAVIAGQGTIGLELAQQLEPMLAQPGRSSHDVHVLVPVGGGGLIAGVAVAIKALLPGSRVIAVEPAAFAKTGGVLDGSGSGERAPTSLTTIADGLRVARLGAGPRDLISSLVDDSVMVDDDAIRRAVLRAAFETHLVLEPAGAASLAALDLVRPNLPPTAIVVCVVTGGNVDPETYQALLH